MSDIDQQLYGTDMLGYSAAPAKAPLATKFLIPPFSVLNAREGVWQDRKRAWLSLGIQSEVGRDSQATWGINPNGTDSNGSGRAYTEKAKTNRLAPGGTGENTCWLGQNGKSGNEGAAGTSIFDPVLCELFYRWFTAPGAQIVDPFSGGSVRGVVASLLGRKYWGCDLRQEQIDANLEQGRILCGEDYPMPEWVCGDSALETSFAPDADAIFGCPPYGALEVYSDLPEDLSAMEPAAFLAAYRGIIATCCERLKPDRFACFVVGDYRNKAGFYENFISETIRAFLDAGLRLYNEMILVTSVGSLPVRITKQFEGGRKAGKSHQNVLVFVKGDWKRAANYCAGIENKSK